MSAHGLFAQDLSPVNSNNTETSQKDVTRFQLFFSAVSLNLDYLPIDDINIIFFVGSYVGRSILRRRKCSVCRKHLVNGSKPCKIDDSIPDENEQLFLQVDRS